MYFGLKNLWWRLSPRDGTRKMQVPVARYVHAVYHFLFWKHLLVNGLLQLSSNGVTPIGAE